MGMRALVAPWPVCRAALRGTVKRGAAPYPGSVVIDQKDAGLNKGLVVLFPRRS